VQQASHGLHLNGFLAKPITPVSLIQNLGSALGKVSAEGPSPIRLQPRVKVNLGPLRGARILLVEDNEINQELALELLVNHGLTVEVANNGQEALEMLDQASFDAVLMDCQMPVMDGQTATRHIRRDGRFQDLPVIAMTANAMLGDRDEILELGMNDYIAKPIRVNEMFATLAKWLRPDLDLEAEPVRPCPATKQTLSLPPMPGIEPEAGLMTTNGDQALYHRLLIKFRDREGEFIQRFDAALSDRQMDEAQRLAHTLKGLAGNIGAHSLQQAAARLERLCTANTDQLHEALSGVESQLQQVLTGLQGLVEEQSPAPTQQDLSQLVPLLRKLHGLVAMNKVDTEGLLDDVRSMLTEPQQQEAFSRVVQAIEGYDFDSAMDELGALMQQLGVDP
jgi:CheY-like chemotaxis protein